MIRRVSLAALSVGTVLIIYGFSTLDSVPASFWRFITDTRADHVVWLMIAGILFFCLGAGGAILSPNPIRTHSYPRTLAAHPRARPDRVRPFWSSWTRK